MSWRTFKDFSQIILAKETGLSRPYVSRLEQNKADPSLSVIRRLAVALDISLGKLLEEIPPRSQLSSETLDRWAREALQPKIKSDKKNPYTRSLRDALKDKRAALGLFKPRGNKTKVRGQF